MPQTQYVTTVRKAHEASTGFVRSYSDAVEAALSASAKVLRPVDPAPAVDQAEQVGVTVLEQTERAKGALREQAESAQQAAHEQFVASCEELIKPGLQDVLRKRDLAETGDVDELHERLVADDE